MVFLFKDNEKDAGIILGDGNGNSASPRYRFNRRRIKSVKSVEVAFSERFWNSIESILVWFKCWRFFKSLNMSVVCERVDEVSRKFFPIMFLILNFVYWVSYIYILWTTLGKVCDGVESWERTGPSLIFHNIHKGVTP